MQQVERAIEELERNLEFLESSKYERLDTVAQGQARMSCRRLGNMYRIVGREEEADKVLSQIKEADVGILMERGRTCLFRGKYDEAVDLYKHSLLLLEELARPQRYKVRAWRQLGHVYMSQGRLEEARISFLRSLAGAKEINDHFDINAAQSNISILDKDINTLNETVEGMNETVEGMNETNWHKGKVSIVCWYLVVTLKCCTMITCVSCDPQEPKNSIMTAVNGPSRRRRACA